METLPLLDDCRQQLPLGNAFRFCHQNGMPAVPGGVSRVLVLRTASEIQADRLARKRALKLARKS